MDPREERVAERDMRPARGDRGRHPPHQRRKERPVGAAPWVIAEAGAARIQCTNGPRVAPGPAGIFDGRRRGPDRGRRVGVRYFLDRGLVGASLRQGRSRRIVLGRRGRARRGRRRRDRPGRRLLGKRRQGQHEHRRCNQKRLSAHCLPAARRLRLCESAAAWAASRGNRAGRSAGRRR